MGTLSCDKSMVQNFSLSSISSVAFNQRDLVTIPPWTSCFTRNSWASNNFHQFLIPGCFQHPTTIPEPRNPSKEVTIQDMNHFKGTTSQALDEAKLETPSFKEWTSKENLHSEVDKFYQLNGLKTPTKKR